MGFIDQIMGAMGMEAAQTVTEEPTSNADPQRTEETKADEVKEKAEKIETAKQHKAIDDNVDNTAVTSNDNQSDDSNN